MVYSQFLNARWILACHIVNWSRFDYDAPYRTCCQLHCVWRIINFSRFRLTEAAACFYAPCITFFYLLTYLYTVAEVPPVVDHTKRPLATDVNELRDPDRAILTRHDDLSRLHQGHRSNNIVHSEAVTSLMYKPTSSSQLPNKSKTTTAATHGNGPFNTVFYPGFYTRGMWARTRGVYSLPFSSLPIPSLPFPLRSILHSYPSPNGSFCQFRRTTWTLLLVVSLLLLRDFGALFHWTVELLHPLIHLRSVSRHFSLIRHNRTVARASVLWRYINWLIDWLIDWLMLWLLHFLFLLLLLLLSFFFLFFLLSSWQM